MSLFSILSSPSQRRSFLLLSLLILGIGLVGIFGLAFYAPNTPVWAALNSFFISVVSGGCLSLASSLYLLYFFEDPNEIAASSVLLPKDIGETLKNIAKRAPSYRIFVRTGRHFRSEILPILVNYARQNRRRIIIEIVLLDFRDEALCSKYADYRKASSFDRNSWSLEYVQTEVLATVLKLIEAINQNRELINIHLFLSRRLSTFRIEGSSDEILVTREDPRDNAARYLRSHHDFSAFVNEFDWIRDEATEVCLKRDDGSPASLNAIFGESNLISRLENQAMEATKSGSPYVR